MTKEKDHLPENIKRKINLFLYFLITSYILTIPSSSFTMSPNTVNNKTALGISAQNTQDILGGFSDFDTSVGFDKNTFETPIPNDPLFPDQWDLQTWNPLAGTYGNGWIELYKLVKQIEATGQLHPIDRPITVVVMDSGVSITNPDITNSIWTNSGEIPNNEKDDDSNGYIDDAHGCSFVETDNCPSAEVDTSVAQHGTGVAGIIAAETDNEIGIAGGGYGFDIQIIPVKVMQDNGVVNYSDIREALQYIQDLIDNGIKIDVVNMSFAGWPSNESAIADLNQMIDNLTNQGVIFVAGSGNSANSEDGVGWPAKLPNVIAVGGYNQNGEVVPKYSHGPELNIIAPGVGIKTTCYPGKISEGFCTFSGTSFASPRVTQAVAFIKAFIPNATFEEILTIIENSGGEEFSDKRGNGPIDLGKIANTILLPYKTYLPIIIN